MEPAPTTQDFTDFLENYNDPNFRKLFEEFIKTSKNPDELAKFIDDMKKMQLNPGSDATKRPPSLPQEEKKPSQSNSSSQLTVPTQSQVVANKRNEPPQDPLKSSHGFCFRTSAKIYRNYTTIALPVYINVTHSELIKPALARKNCSHGFSKSHGKCTEHEHTNDLPEDVRYAANYWEIPRSNAKREVSTNQERIYTVCFSTLTFHKARREPAFKELLIATALQIVEDEHDEVLDKKNYTVLSDLAFKVG